MRARIALAIAFALSTVVFGQQPRQGGARTPAPKTPAAGTAVARVVEKKASSGSTAYALVADGRPVPLVARFYPVYYKMDSLLDSFSILSLETSQYSEERGGKRQ